MQVQSFLHLETETYTHILIDHANRLCAIIDPVLDYEFKSGRTSTHSADLLIDFIEQNQLSVQYIIETHAHADHLSAGHYLKQKLGGELVIGKHITKVQTIFKQVFNLDTGFKTDASQFDKLTDEGDWFVLGDIKLSVMHVPGHTPADMAYIAKNTINNNQPLAIFVGDTLFAPDVGTARVDFPGGDVYELYRSIRRILSLPEDTLIYLCHDYPPKDRQHTAVTSVAAQKAHNIHIHDGISQEEFVIMRTQRDAKLEMPKLIIPSVQVNIRAGELPDPEDNGVRYLKIPLNNLG